MTNPPGPPPPPPPNQNYPPGPRAAPAQDPSGLPKRSVSVGQILGAVLFVVVVVFILENTRSVKVRLLVPEVTTPLAVPIVIAAVLGALVSWLLRLRREHRHPSRRSRRL
jgi:uncharacterized integral membrane protein